MIGFTISSIFYIPQSVICWHLCQCCSSCVKCT